MRALPALTLATLALSMPFIPLAAAEEIPLDVFLHEIGARFHVLPPDINGKVGDTFRLNVQNAGASPHDLLVCAEAPKPQTTCDNVLGQTGQIPPQGSEVLVITLMEPGEFEYYGTGFGEKSADMRGLLHVTGEAKKDAPLGTVLPFAALALAAFVAIAFRRRSP